MAKLRGAGGTSGGLGQFFLGFVLAALGVYLFLDRVNVGTTFGSMFGGHFGLVLLPLGLGIGLVFFNGRSILGWLLVSGCLGAIFLSVLANLRFWFAPTSFWSTAGMMGVLGIGVVMMARSLRPT
jgi:hypothetical protein